jgi:hypothetical protein
VIFGPTRFSGKGWEMADKPNKYDASVQSGKLQRAEDAVRAVSEYEAAGAALRAKTERLKALRLAREAELATTAPKASTAARKTIAKKKKASTGGSLSDWLDREAQEGRRG